MDGISVIAAVDVVADASVTGILKSDRRLRNRPSALGVADPGHVAFIDDQPVNVAGAQAAGLVAPRFDVTEPEASLTAVRERLGLIAAASRRPGKPT